MTLKSITVWVIHRINTLDYSMVLFVLILRRLNDIWANFDRLSLRCYNTRKKGGPLMPDGGNLISLLSSTAQLILQNVVNYDLTGRGHEIFDLTNFASHGCRSGELLSRLLSFFAPIIRSTRKGQAKVYKRQSL